MVERESDRGASSYVAACVNRCMVWLRTNKAMFVMILVVVLIVLVPLYGIMFPPMVDLPEHILISKLLWEKLSGVSHLDLEVSLFLGYRLIPAFMMVVIPFFKLWGISFVYLPRIVSMALISLHATVVVTILCFGLRDKSWKSCALGVCFSVPAAVCMYATSWFYGFVNYTLAITVLIPAVFLTERFLRSGKLVDACFLCLAVFMVYAAHPFAVSFWLLWCVSRTIAASLMGTFRLEWKRLVLLGVIFSPIFLYHFLATRGTYLAPSSQTLLSQPPLLSINDWYQHRLRSLLNGDFFKTDEVSDSRWFGRFAIGLIVFSTVLAFRSAQDQQIKKVVLASVFLILGASWVNEKLIPVPGVHWLAYEHRFSSTVYAICLAVAGMVLIRFLPVSTDRLPYKIIFVLLAFSSVVASAAHLIEVRKAYTRFDAPARRWMAKAFNQEPPTGIYLPRSPYHPDGTYLKNYLCLKQPDCIGPGTFFSTGYGSELYAVKVKAGKKVPTDSLTNPLVGYWKLDEPNRGDALKDSSGNGKIGTPHGTTVVEGKVMKARGFDGIGDYIDIPSISVLEAITVAAWIYSDNFVQDGFVVTKNPASTQWALFFESDGFLKWRGAGVEKNVVCVAPSNNKWHHIVAEQKGNTGSLYVDGVLCASGSPLPVIGNAPNSLSIGRSDAIGYGYFSGRIDEVRIYNRALSGTEISQLFTTLSSSKEPLQ